MARREGLRASGTEGRASSLKLLLGAQRGRSGPGGMAEGRRASHSQGHSRLHGGLRRPPGLTPTVRDMASEAPRRSG